MYFLNTKLIDDPAYGLGIDAAILRLKGKDDVVPWDELIAEVKPQLPQAFLQIFGTAEHAEVLKPSKSALTCHCHLEIRRNGFLSECEILFIMIFNSF